MEHKSSFIGTLIANIKPMIWIFASGLLCACGGGGNNATGTNASSVGPDISGSPLNTVISTPSNTDIANTVISGAGVKGPLAFAKVSVYALDTSKVDYYDPQSPVATASTNAQAEIVGLQIPQNFPSPFVMVIDGTNATDLNTGTTPVITTLITVISQTMLDTGRPLYATPLTTLAFYMARREAGVGAANGTVQNALISAANQINATLGFGMSPTIDLFTTPPVINNYTTTFGEQQAVAEYRAAIEALSAMIYQMAVSQGNGLKAEYFNSVDLTNPALTRTDATVNFDWGTGAPAPGVGADGFSVRWSGLIEPAYTETYTFYTDSDDGVRLWVNGQLLIDNWTDHGATEDSATLALVAGQKYTIKMEYYDSSWQCGRQAAVVQPQPGETGHSPGQARCQPRRRQFSASRQHPPGAPGL